MEKCGVTTHCLYRHSLTLNYELIEELNKNKQHKQNKTKLSATVNQKFINGKRNLNYYFKDSSSKVFLSPKDQFWELRQQVTSN